MGFWARVIFARCPFAKEHRAKIVVEPMRTDLYQKCVFYDFNFFGTLKAILVS